MEEGAYKRFLKRKCWKLRYDPSVITHGLICCQYFLFRGSFPFELNLLICEEILKFLFYTLQPVPLSDKLMPEVR